MIDFEGSRSRAFLVLHELKNKLDAFLPTNQDLLRYREQIAEGSSSDLNRLLHLERNLAEERASLKSQIHSMTNDWKKKEMVIAKSRLQVVEKKRHKTSKELNRLIMISEVVTGNMRKLVEELQSVKLQLEIKMSPQASAVNIETLETTIQKKEAALKHETDLKEGIAALKKKMEQQEASTKHLDQVESEVQHAKNILAMNQSGDNPTLKRLFRDVVADRDAQKRTFRSDVNALQEQIENSKTQLGYENESNRQSIQFLNERLEFLNSKVATLKSKTKQEILQLDSEVIEAKRHREENMKELLKLRVIWRKYESEKKEKEANAAVKERDDQHQNTRMDAADFIQRRLFLLYRLKFKNMPKAGLTKKKSKSGKRSKREGALK